MHQAKLVKNYGKITESCEMPDFIILVILQISSKGVRDFKSVGGPSGPDNNTFSLLEMTCSLGIQFSIDGNGDKPLNTEFLFLDCLYSFNNNA